MAPVSKIRHKIGLTLKIIAGVLLVLNGLLAAGHYPLHYRNFPPVCLMVILACLALGWTGEKIDRSN